MLAYAEMTDVAIWVQTTQNASVHIRYKKSGASEAWTKTPNKSAEDQQDNIVVFKISGLATGTKYDYDLYINNTKVERSYPLQFQTQPHWRWAANPPVPPTINIAIGSCAYITDETMQDGKPKFDRPGNPYGGEFDIFSSIHKTRPDFMVWLGDNVYYREPDWLTEEAMRYRWRKDRQLGQLQALLGSTHHYGIWDDHDFGPNDSDGSFRMKEAALRVFSDYFPQVQYGTSETKGCFHRFEWGDVEFFMLDNRYHRTPNRFPDGPDKVMFGAQQLRWLKEALSSSNATFKIVAGGNQMLNPMTFFEAFGRFPIEQKSLFDWLAAAKIEGLVFLSGDRHTTELLKVQWPGAAYPYYEYTSSPLTSGSGRDAREADNPARVPGTWVTQKRNFGRLVVSGPWRDRKLTMSAHDKDGVELWKHEIKESDLKVPRAN